MLNKIFNRKYYKAMEQLDFEITFLTNEFVRVNNSINAYLSNGGDFDGHYTKLANDRRRLQDKIEALKHLRTSIISINA